MSQNEALPPLPDDADGPHSLIYRAYRDGELHLGLKYFHLNARGSPVYKLWENVVPFAMIVAIVAQYTYDHGLWGFVGSLAITGLLGFYFIPRWLAKRVRMRGLDMAMSGEPGWDRLWQFGALSLRLSSDPEIACDSPEGDWRTFARQHLSP